jgi:hypothetical protein
VADVTTVPTNAMKSAADGAMLPLIVFTLLFALAAGESTRRSASRWSTCSAPSPVRRERSSTG